ncbi:MAG: DUF885 domain-containing protein [Acidobacteriota bacterium]
MRFVLAAALAALCACSSTPKAEGPATGAPGKSVAFAKFVDAYFDASNAWSPTGAVTNGFHEYDARIEDRSKAAHEARIALLKTQSEELAALRKTALAPDEAIDAELIESAIQSELLSTETLADWKTNPMSYAGLPGGAVDVLMKRNFAPAKERLQSMVARMKGIPALMAAMKANVENPPKEFTDIAMLMTGGSVGFFQGAVAEWAKEAAGGDTALLKEFETADAAAVKSLQAGAAWLKSDLLARSKGKYAIGKEMYAKALLYDEMIDLPLERVLAVGEANLEKDYKAFVATAKEIDAKKTPMEVMHSITDTHPTEATLLPDARNTIEATRQFLIDHRIVTVPSEVRPTVTETPPFARDGNFASMDTPGAYETKATEAFYYVTPPEKDWPEKRKEEHLRLYNPPVLKMITVHEAYPGHYLQFLFAKQFPTKTRKLVFCGSNVEGWAHYSEQMMVEEGFGEKSPQIRLAQLKEALIRDCRYVAGIKLHTAGWTVEQATKLFMEKSFEEREVSFQEARRGTYNPTYLYYTLGKLMIYKLREDYRREQGAAYSMQKFHDEFVRQGGVPLKIVRKLMLKDGSGQIL